jgi:hypothetical protein
MRAVDPQRHHARAKIPGGAPVRVPRATSLRTDS